MYHPSLSYDVAIAQPFVIPRTREGLSEFDVVRNDELTATLIHAHQEMVTRGFTPSWVCRISGGCKGLTEDKVQDMFPYFISGFGADVTTGEVKQIPAGMVSSGVTKEQGSKVMVTQIPGVLARKFPVWTFGSTPQTERFGLTTEGAGLRLNGYGTSIDVQQHEAAVQQAPIYSPSTTQGWDADVRAYMRSLLHMQNQAGLRACVIGFNGGDITMDELLLAVASGIPVIVVAGSGRAADEYAHHFENHSLLGLFEKSAWDPNRLLEVAEVDDLTENQVEALSHIANFDDPATLRQALDACAVA